MSHTYIEVGSVEYRVEYEFYEGDESAWDYQGVPDRVDIEKILVGEVDIYDIVSYGTIQEFERIIMNNYE